MSDQSSRDALREAALAYHRTGGQPGKIEVVPTKPLVNQRDLALAYSPGVAAACEEIVTDPKNAAELTARSNLVAVITNGTAVLGLGPIGPLAAKPVMEGKGVLFKKFAGIDVFDVEIDELDPEKLINIVASLEPTFGGINLEDIKAPECFIVEKALRKRMKIPVFHDDQHGTAIIVSAAILNGLRIVEKEISKIKVVVAGAGAAALACLDLLVQLGLNKANVTVCDVVGVVYEGRTELMDPWKSAWARKTKARVLAEVMPDADVFIGLSAPNVLSPEVLKTMAPRPLVFALANPTPEIMPEIAKAARPDAIIATGRSDYPNQVNNVLCFPYIFRGALDVGATAINDEMKLACVRALSELAMAEAHEAVVRAYGDEELRFGPDYIIPKPFDPRLIVQLAPAVAKSAMESGVATRPIADFEAYKEKLSRYVYRSGLLMKPVFERARSEPKRVVYAEGEDERVLRAAQAAVDERLAKPILVGRPDVISRRIERLGLRIRIGQEVEIVNPLSDPRYDAYTALYHEIMARKGISPAAAKTVVRSNTTVIAALMLRRKEADAMLCGTVGPFRDHLADVEDVIGKGKDVRHLSSMSGLILRNGTFFICDTYVSPDPSAEEIAETVQLAAASIRRFGVSPKVALLSHSNFGTTNFPSAVKMRDALAILRRETPDLEVDGEMHADAALNETIRAGVFPGGRLKGQANLLVMPNLDTANIAFNLLKVLGDGLPLGPLLIGQALPVHILTPSVTARGILNMTAVAAVDAQNRGDR